MMSFSWEIVKYYFLIKSRWWIGICLHILFHACCVARPKHFCVFFSSSDIPDSWETDENLSVQSVEASQCPTGTGDSRCDA